MGLANDEVNAMKIVVCEDGKTYEKHERIREMAYYTPWGRQIQVEKIVEYRECVVDQAVGADSSPKRDTQMVEPA
jgi:hypothetical protein